MTNEQHIENLKKLRSFHNGSFGTSINAAINALEHEQALGEAFNIAFLYGKEKGMEAIDKALYQMGMDGIKEQEIKVLVEQEPKWDRLYSWLNDMRLGIAPDETVTDIDERNVRTAQVDLLDEIMEWMVEPQESDHKCHTCKHYMSGEKDGSCGSYICKGYSNWESEDKESEE